MKDLKEAEKNFFSCAALTLLVGIALLVMGKNTTGILSVTAAVIFAVVGIRMVLTRTKGKLGENKDHGSKS